MNQGYVKLWRKTKDCGLMMNPNAFTVFSWMLLTASRKKQKTTLGGKIIELEPGQLVYGRRMITNEVGISEQTARTCVALLESLGMITSKSTNHGSVITVVNWDTYQACEQPTNQQVNQRPTSDQPTGNQRSTTKQEVSEVREVKKDRGTAAAFVPPTIEEVEAYCKHRGNVVAPHKWFAHYEANGWMIGKNKMKNWKAAIHTWEPEGHKVDAEGHVKPRKLQVLV